MFEKDLPGQNTAGFNAEARIGNLPLETCETVNNSWGYNAKDKKFKSAKELIHYLARAAGHNANFLLNVGPRPDGTIQPEFVERLKEVGAWLAKYGESIYGTRGGPIPPRDWGVTTRKGTRVYLHLLKLEDEVLAFPKFGAVKSALLLKDGSKVEILENQMGYMLRVPMDARDPIDTVLVLQTQ